MKEGEEKVDAYIRVMRQIMMKHGGFLDGSAWRAEDRVEYIKAYRGLISYKEE